MADAGTFDFSLLPTFRFETEAEAINVSWWLWVTEDLVAEHIREGKVHTVGDGSGFFFGRGAQHIVIDDFCSERERPAHEKV